jgi:hypothetical protein
MFDHRSHIIGGFICVFKLLNVVFLAQHHDQDSPYFAVFVEQIIKHFNYGLIEVMIKAIVPVGSCVVSNVEILYSF